MECKQCKEVHPPSAFVGKRGPTKTCQTCRDKDNERNMRPEIVAKRAARLRERQNATEPPPGTPDGYVKCTNCPQWKDPSEFIGKKGDVVLRCTRCRTNDDNKKRKPEVREKHKARMRATRSDMKYRAKMRAEDEAGFLRRNADAHFAYTSKSLPHRISSLEYGATRRGHVFELDDAMVEKLVRTDCWYCGSPPKIEFNGIDRKDNTAGYTEDNCVPCCATCNFMKKCLDHATFIKRCKHIAGDGIYEDAWPRASSIVPDGLCTFCGGPASGAPHCVECIRMKANTKLTPDEFVAKAREVSAHWPEPPESDHVCVRCIVKRTNDSVEARPVPT